MADDPTDRTSPVAPADAPPRPAWGPWASLGWTALAAGMAAGTQLLTLVGFAVARLMADPRSDVEALGADGRVVAVGILAGVPPVLGFIALLVRARGWRFGAYLALRPAPAGGTALAVLGLVLGLAASDGLTLRLGRPAVPPVVVEAVLGAPLWLVALAVAVGAPVVEEVLCRGFLYRGLAESPRLGPGMAIGLTALAWAGLTALAWAGLNVQYDLYGLATIYLIGLYLGLIRHLAGSTLLTIFLHCLVNIAATAQAIRFAG